MKNFQEGRKTTTKKTKHSILGQRKFIFVHLQGKTLAKSKKKVPMTYEQLLSEQRGPIWIKTSIHHSLSEGYSYLFKARLFERLKEKIEFTLH